jgi:hypothetical protein
MSIKSISMILVMAAFLAGAFVSVLDPDTVDWNWMVPILLVGAVGLWQLRKANHGEANASHRLTGNMETLGVSLANIHRNLEALCARKTELPVYEARFEIDRLFREDLNDFAEARETMIHVFGMQKPVRRGQRPFQATAVRSRHGLGCGRSLKPQREVRREASHSAPWA